MQNQLIVLFTNIKDGNFVRYEEKVIKQCLNLVNVYEFDERKVFIFDLSEYILDISKFLNGKYSTLSDRVKKLIVTYWDAKINRDQLYTVVYPDTFFKKVAEELGVTEEYLRKVGELFDVYDADKEHLEIIENNNQLMLEL